MKGQLGGIHKKQCRNAVQHWKTRLTNWNSISRRSYAKSFRTRSMHVAPTWSSSSSNSDTSCLSSTQIWRQISACAIHSQALPHLNLLIRARMSHSSTLKQMHIQQLANMVYIFLFFFVSKDTGQNELCAFPAGYAGIMSKCQQHHNMYHFTKNGAVPHLIHRKKKKCVHCLLECDYFHAPKVG